MINVFLHPLPCRIKALTTKNDDGSFTILINSRLNCEQQRKSYLHEIKHIKNNDFDKYNVDSIECQSRKEDEKIG